VLTAGEDPRVTVSPMQVMHGSCGRKVIAPIVCGAHQQRRTWMLENRPGAAKSAASWQVMLLVSFQ